MRAVGKFGPAIAGHRAAGVTGQGPQRLGDLRHDRLRALLLVLRHQKETTAAFDHRGDTGGAVFLLDQRQMVRRACADQKEKSGSPFSKAPNWPCIRIKRASASSMPQIAPQGLQLPEGIEALVVEIRLHLRRLIDL